MKKIMLFLLLLMLMGITGVQAQESEYLPVLTEGKLWEVATINRDYPTDTTSFYNITVAGDTLVNNYMCKKIMIVPKYNQGDVMTAIAYEENGKVCTVTKNGDMELLFDIGFHLYDLVDMGYVAEEDVICVNGINRKRLLIDSGIDCEDYTYYVVEGIGISTDKFILTAGSSIGNENEYAIMLSCSENGETIFTYKDFKITPTIHADVDGNGEVDVRDITQLIAIIMNSSSDRAADIDVNGEIDVRDITALIDIIMSSKSSH